MKVLVTGGHGQLGLALRYCLPLSPLADGNELKVLFASHAEYDLSSSVLHRQLDLYLPDVIVNCAAFNAVDDAEHQVDLAYAINSHAPRRLAQWCSDNQRRLIHISSDYVFAGNIDGPPYAESDCPSPLSVYGKSKLAAEQAVLAVCPSATVLRTAWLYSHWGQNFLVNMRRRLLANQSLSVVSDQIGSPTWAVALASVIWLLIAEDAQLKAPFHSTRFGGLFHYAGAGQGSWYELVCEIHQHLLQQQLISTQQTHILNPISTADYVTMIAPTSALRPSYSVLSSQKLQSLLPTSPSWLWQPWRQQLERCMTSQITF